MKSLKDQLSGKWVTWETKLRLYSMATPEERTEVEEFIGDNILEAYKMLGEDYCRMITTANPDSSMIVRQFLDEYKRILDPHFGYKKELWEIIRRAKETPGFTSECQESSFHDLFRDFKVLNLDSSSCSFDVLDILWFFWIVEKDKYENYNIIQEYCKDTFDIDDLFFLIFNEKLNYESIFRIYINFDRSKRRIFEEENIYPDMTRKLEVLGFARIMELKLNKEKLDTEMNYVINTLEPIFRPKFSRHIDHPYAFRLSDFIDLYTDIYSELKPGQKRLVQNDEDSLYDLSLLCPQRFSYSFINYKPRTLL